MRSCWGVPRRVRHDPPPREPLSGSPMEPSHFIIGPDDPILVTGVTGFIGPALVQSLLNHGFRNLRAFARPSSDVTRLEAVARCRRGEARIDVIRGNLLSREDCVTATRGVAVIFHLATSGRTSFPDAFMNSVVTTRNLLESSLRYTRLRRFVNISSFAVYTNARKPRWRLLDESSPVEKHGESRGDAYGFAKIRQDEIVTEYGNTFGVPYVIDRPGSVYGSGKEDIPGRVGIGTFGIFLHLGGSNPILLAYIDNCADAIVLAGLTRGADGEAFNVVDDDPPSSRQLLRLYKRHVRCFPSIYVPHVVSYVLCWLWEKYSRWSDGQLPPVFNRKRWHAEWKKTRYSNEKVKARLGWAPKVPVSEGLTRYFQGCRDRRHV
jgi:nucleoside-diphosphate-sugar epimerase